MFPLIIYLNITFLQTVLHHSSQQSDIIYPLFNYFNSTSGVLLLLLIFLVLYISIKHRQKVRDADDSVQIERNTKLKILMGVVTALLLGSFFYHTVNPMWQVSPITDSGRKFDVLFIGHQWWWKMDYPGLNTVAAKGANHPVENRFLMRMLPAETIQEWWIPKLENNMDQVPGTEKGISPEIDKPGKYLEVGGEFEGMQYAWKRINMIAQQRNEFTQRLKQNTNKNFRGLDGSF